MDLSVQTYRFALSICSFIFGMFNYSTECDLCSDGQLISESHWDNWQLISIDLRLFNFLMVAIKPVFLSLGTSFFTDNHNFSSIPWQPSFFVVTKVFVAPDNK